MTTRQSTTLHMSGDGEDPNNGLAFSTIDAGDPEAGNPGEIRQVLEVWGTIEAPDGQLLTARMKVGMPDVRDLQAFLNDNYARNKAPKAGADAALQTQIDGANAQYFKDGWAASLRELLEMSKVRGYEAAIEWAKNQYLGASDPVEHEPTTGGVLPGEEEYPVDAGGHVNDLAFYETPNDPWQPKAGDAANVYPMTATMPDGEQKPGYVVTPRQCAVIYNDVRCLKPEGHEGSHDMYADAPMQGHQPDVDLFIEQAAAIERADATRIATVDLTPNLVPGPKNAAEQERKRRLKVEIAFDEAAAAYRLDPHNNGAVNDLAKAVAELRKREPDNSRIANWDTTQAVAAVIGNGLPTEAPQPEQLPEAHFAPEPAQAAPNYLAQESHPSNQQFAQAAAAMPGVHLQDSVTMTQEQYKQESLQTQQIATINAQQAAQAFPCPHKASDERPCLRPAGHEIELPHRPAVPHVYATNPASLDAQPVNANNTQYLPAQQPPTPAPYVAPAQPFQQPHLQAVPDQTNVAVMSFHEGEPGMPAAPAMPTWQAPQQ